MTGLVTLGQLPGTAAQLPCPSIYPWRRWPCARWLVQDELPRYLLAQVKRPAPLYVPDLHRKMLLATLWNTGARINEALALTRSDFSLTPPYPFVQLATLEAADRKQPDGRKECQPVSRLTEAGSALRLLGTSASCRRWWQH